MAEWAGRGEEVAVLAVDWIVNGSDHRLDSRRWMPTVPL
jgi:hypothetical protein